jgi:ATP-dependent DNA ligase
MAHCRWLKPVLVGQFEFLEWTGDNHLRHSKFIPLREDKKTRDVNGGFGVVENSRSETERSVLPALRVFRCYRQQSAHARRR